jgi:hypothetical protein
VHDLLALRRLPDLPDLAEPSERDAAPPDPEVTAVMAVRDDAVHVADSVRGLLAQQRVRLRVVVVDDRSSDGTARVLAELAARDERLRVETVRELPPDWLGKTHALHVGAADVHTRWLLFTDGDAHLGADTIARAVRAAENANAQHMALVPSNRGASFAGRACLLAFVLSALRRIAAVNGARQRGFVGTGAFNLVRTDAYRAVGGHLPLRLEVVDDVWLGCLLLRGGFRTRVWLAPRAFAVDWGATPREFVRVTTKNMFAVLRYRTPLAVAAIVSASALIVLPFVAPWLAGPWGFVPLGACALTALPAALLARRLDWPPLTGLLVPIANLVLPIAMLHSTWVTLRQGGVRWRGTFYALATLRRGQVR